MSNAYDEEIRNGDGCLFRNITANKLSAKANFCGGGSAICKKGIHSIAANVAMLSPNRGRKKRTSAATAIEVVTRYSLINDAGNGNQ